MPPTPGSERTRACRRRKAEMTAVVTDYEIKRSLIDTMIAWGFLGECDDSDPARLKEAFAEFVDYLTGCDPA